LFISLDLLALRIECYFFLAYIDMSQRSLLCRKLKIVGTWQHCECCSNIAKCRFNVEKILQKRPMSVESVLYKVRYKIRTNLNLNFPVSFDFGGKSLTFGQLTYL